MRRARFLAGLSQLSLKKYDEAFATFKALADARADAAVLNNLGVVQLRRGGTPQTGQPTYYFNKAADADPDDPDYLFNLGYAYWLERDPQAAIYWLREAVAPQSGRRRRALRPRRPRSPPAGNAAEAARERELARRLSSDATKSGKRPGGDAVPKGLERIKHDVELPHARRVERAARHDRAARARGARAVLSRSRAAPVPAGKRSRRDRRAESRDLPVAVPGRARTCCLAALYLRTGRVHEAIDAFKIVAVERRNRRGATPRWARPTARSNDLARRAPKRERALALDPASADARQLLAKLEGR